MPDNYSRPTIIVVIIVIITVSATVAISCHTLHRCVPSTPQALGQQVVFSTPLPGPLASLGLAQAFHLLTWLVYAAAFLWHTTPGAQYLLEKGREFGWFFRHLTFWSFTL